MGPVPAVTPPPDANDVAGIVAIADPIIRNLRITWCYHQLAVAFAARTGPCSNWCTFATWASRQAGQTIRGEDLLSGLERKLRIPGQVLHPFQSLWRAVLRKGVFDPQTRFGRAVREIHSPFDAFERAGDAVSRGNRKVFEEIGSEFARYLRSCPPEVAVESPEFQEFLKVFRPGPPPDGQDFLRQAFTRYQKQRNAPDTAAGAQSIFLANLEIGLHEQTRLQPEILESLNAPSATAEDLGGRVLHAMFPGARHWMAVFRGPAAAILGLVAGRLARFAVALTRGVITESAMVLSLPGGVALALGRNLDKPFPPELREIRDPDLSALLERIEPAPPAADDCGAKDWSELPQRMHYIAHLFRSMHLQSTLFQPPFQPDQVRLIETGVVPEGDL